MTSRNEELFARAQRTIPGGVNSPVRAFRSVGGTPRFLKKALGARVWDADGKEYLDYVGSWGPAILGHADPVVVEAVRSAALDGLSFGAPTEREIEMAERLCALLPSMEMVRLVSSGTEATMSAIRLARGFTGRDAIVKFEGCYHGHADSLLVKAGSGLLTFGNPSSAGVPEDFAKHTLVLDYNDPAQLEETFKARGGEIACVIIEPIAGNMNLIKPSAEFMHLLRRLCTEHGAVLIFDEVMTGFRVGPRGVQGLFGITPDLTTLGKVIGGGMPVGAFGGRRDIMQQVSPAGPVYQAGTLSGNPLAMTAGLATLQIITKEPEPGEADYSRSLTLKTKKLLLGWQEKAKEAGVAIQVHQAGSMFGIFFNDQEVYNYEDSCASDQQAFKVWFRSMLEQGIYLAPSQFETLFMSGAHSEADIERTIEAAGIAFAAVASSRC